MIDTVKLRSPHISSELAAIIAESCKRLERVDLATGEVEMSITSGSLQGSYDDRISVRIETEEIIRDSKGTIIGRDFSCEPYLTIEGSVHKALLGHNVYGGPNDPYSSMCWFVSQLGDRLGCDLPAGDKWIVRRIDWAECYELGSSAAVSEYISALNNASFPRRTIMRYGNQCVFAPGERSAVRLYHKGPEFRKHDRRKWYSAGREEDADVLQLIADNILRAEVEIKAHMLDAEYETPYVEDIEKGWLEMKHDNDVIKLLREGRSEYETVRTAREVRNRLHSIYGSSLANNLYGVWLQFSTLGENEARTVMSRPTYYRQRKQLMEAGCAWHGTDVMLREYSAIPQGFSPVRSDSRRMAAVAEEVLISLEDYRAVA